MTGSSQTTYDHFGITLPIAIRPCRADDLRRLEWFGWFTPHRALFEETFDRQRRGEALMLVAEARDFPVGQIWIDLTRKQSERTAVLWALRVLPGLQSSGIGSRLVARAEALIRTRGYAWSEIGVDRGNDAARRLYERLGYVVVGADHHYVDYTTPSGEHERMEVDEWLLRRRLAPPLVVRWTIGDVSREGFEALRLSVWSATRLLGSRARYVVCVNSISLDEARARTGALPASVEWRDVTDALWPELQPYLGDNLAEGVAWKFAPLRLDDTAHELALDNDCILWSLPRALAEWIESPTACVLAEDVRACFGQFASQCGPEPRNSGIRGLPATFDLGAAILDMLRESPTVLTSELDEQGLQVAALSRDTPPKIVSTREVTICSPFPPHLPHLGDCGAHFVGLNAKSLPWELDGRPAVEHIRAHWRKHRRALYERVGLAPAAADDRSRSPVGNGSNRSAGDANEA
ncbi:MAG TPA: GNAT family N-acetyltransferase [Gemmatimonadaceae bacterium]|nr:GNAT family N-acetyltransferase [Gemmatimonadaceae bacterium]